jgi:hypothetical protein
MNFNSIIGDLPLGGMKPLLALKGKLWIQMENGGKMIGFKFVMGTTFPQHPPQAFLDEPIKEEIFEFFDYVKPGNVLDFAYLHDWKVNFNSNPNPFNLQ